MYLLNIDKNTLKRAKITKLNRKCGSLHAGRLIFGEGVRESKITIIAVFVKIDLATGL